MFAELRKKIPVGKILLEFFSIIIAVLMAFLVNEWRQNRADAILADTALHNILEELQQNNQFLEKNNPFHEKLFNSLTEKNVQLRDGSD